MRRFLLTFPAFLLALAMTAASLARPACAASDAEIINGFNLTMFGAEFSPFGYQSDYIRKFNGPVLFDIQNMSRRDRSGDVAAFIGSLNGAIRGLKARMAKSPSQANFTIYIVERRDYAAVVRDKLYGRVPDAALGRCHVRTVFSRAGIRRSDAVIVADDGDALFDRCKAEEILQGLGPLNESPLLGESMFNDRSRHTRFTRFDQLILNMLYDPRIRTGASRSSVQSLLPTVLRDARARLR